MATKFSQFTNGGTLLGTDEIVGLRGGVNTRFTSPSLTNNGWSVVVTSQNLAVNRNYFMNNVVAQVFLLPATAALGDTISIANIGASTFTITQNAGQFIQFGNLVSTTGLLGSIGSNATGDSLTLVCSVANTTFVVVGGSQGIWTVT